MVSLFQSIMTVTYIQHVHTAGKVKCFYKKIFLIGKSIYLIGRSSYRILHLGGRLPSPPHNLERQCLFWHLVKIYIVMNTPFFFKDKGWSLRYLKPIFISIYVYLIIWYVSKSMENCFRRDLLLYCTLYAGISAGYRCVSMDQMIRASFHLIVSVITNGSNNIIIVA